MNNSVDAFPDSPLPLEDLIQSTAQSTLCLVNNGRHNACGKLICNTKDTQESRLRSLTLSNIHPFLELSDGKNIDYTRNGFIERLSNMAQAFCCQEHKQDRKIHAYYPYIWVAHDLMKRGSQYRWEKQKLDWFGLRPATESLEQASLPYPPFVNENKDFCYLDSLERCANYLPKFGKQRFVEALHNMVRQGKAMTKLDDEQLVQVDALLRRLEGSQERQASFDNDTRTDRVSDPKPSIACSVQQIPYDAPTVKIRSFSYLRPWSLRTWFAYEPSGAAAVFVSSFPSS